MIENAKSFDQELFKGCGAGKKARVAEVGLHEHTVRPHRNRMRERAHGAQDVIVIKILPFFLGEKREEFFF
jgi:hypothetical protein